MSDHTRVTSNGRFVICLNCGDTDRFDLPAKLSDLSELLDEFSRAHAGCVRNANGMRASVLWELVTRDAAGPISASAISTLAMAAKIALNHSEAVRLLTPQEPTP